MSTRQSDAAAMAGRCRRVGWNVVYGRDGWKVITPSGEPVLIHKTYSDRNAMDKVERLLNTYGLDEAEKKVKTAEERRRLQRIQEDRVKNEKVLAATVKRAKAINIGAGIYAMDEVDIGFLTKPHPAPVCRKVLMTPEMADKLLTLNVHNRPKKKQQIARLVAHIENDTWRLTHQGVALDTRAQLQDGQNRLEAISIAGKAVPIYVFVGMDPEAFPVIDTHVIRSTADTLALTGVEHSATIAAMLRLVFLFDQSAEWTTWGKYPFDNSMSLKMFEENKALVTRAFGEGRLIAGKNGARIPKAPAMAGALLIRRAQGKKAMTQEAVDEFLSGVATGADLRGTQDPRAALRRVGANMAANKGRRPTGEALALLIKAWNAYATGRTVGALAFRKDELMPRPVIVDNGR